MKCLKVNKVMLFILMMIPIRVLAWEGEAFLEFVVNNKDGAVCYDWNMDKSGEKRLYTKTSKVMPYGQTFLANEEFGFDYVDFQIENDGTFNNCSLSKKDLKLKNNVFSLNDDYVYKYDKPVKAVVLASSLNIRKGPATLYDSIGSIPKGEVVNISYVAGSWWFYIEYNGKKGWIYGNDFYLGLEDTSIIYSMHEIPIYDKNHKEIGKIPPLTEITDYLSLPAYEEQEYFIIYNGIKGYIYGDEGNSITTKCSGKIKLLKDAKLYQNEKVVKTIKKGSELEFSVSDSDIGEFYIPKENGVVKLDHDSYQTVEEATYLVKKRGYIGEGLFGEKKTQESQEPISSSESNNNFENEQISGNEKKSTEENKFLILICVLGSAIFILIVIIIFLMINKRKKKMLEKEIESNTSSNEM